MYVYPTSLPRAECNTRSDCKQSKADLNSELDLHSKSEILTKKKKKKKKKKTPDLLFFTI